MSMYVKGQWELGDIVYHHVRECNLASMQLLLRSSLMRSFICFDSAFGPTDVLKLTRKSCLLDERQR
jgi:hypothetical protein